MNRERALDRLAGRYAHALRLADTGSSTADIAAELEIDQAAVDALLRIGAAKLARLIAEGCGATTGPPESPDGPDGRV